MAEDSSIEDIPVLQDIEKSSDDSSRATDIVLENVSEDASTSKYVQESPKEDAAMSPPEKPKDVTSLFAAKSANKKSTSSMTKVASTIRGALIPAVSFERPTDITSLFASRLAKQVIMRPQDTKHMRKKQEQARKKNENRELHAQKKAEKAKEKAEKKAGDGSAEKKESQKLLKKLRLTENKRLKGLFAKKSASKQSMLNTPDGDGESTMSSKEAKRLAKELKKKEQARKKREKEMARFEKVCGQKADKDLQKSEKKLDKYHAKNDKKIAKAEKKREKKAEKVEKKEEKKEEKDDDKETKKADKEAEKAKKNAEKEAAKEAKKAEKEAEKEAKKVEKVIEKQAKQAEKESKKAEKIAEKAEKKAEKAEKKVEKAEKKAEKAEKKAEKEAEKAEKIAEKAEKKAEKEAEKAAKIKSKAEEKAEKEAKKAETIAEKAQKEIQIAESIAEDAAEKAVAKAEKHAEKPEVKAEALANMILQTDGKQNSKKTKKLKEVLVKEIVKTAGTTGKNLSPEKLLVHSINSIISRDSSMKQDIDEDKLKELIAAKTQQAITPSADINQSCEVIDNQPTTKESTTTTKSSAGFLMVDSKETTEKKKYNFDVKAKVDQTNVVEELKEQIDFLEKTELPMLETSYEESLDKKQWLVCVEFKQLMDDSIVEYNKGWVEKYQMVKTLHKDIESNQNDIDKKDELLLKYQRKMQDSAIERFRAVQKEGKVDRNVVLRSLFDHTASLKAEIGRVDVELDKVDASIASLQKKREISLNTNTTALRKRSVERLEQFIDTATLKLEQMYKKQEEDKQKKESKEKQLDEVTDRLGTEVIKILDKLIVLKVIPEDENYVYIKSDYKKIEDKKIELQERCTVLHKRVRTYLRPAEEYALDELNKLKNYPENENILEAKNSFEFAEKKLEFTRQEALKQLRILEIHDPKYVKERKEEQERKLKEEEALKAAEIAKREERKKNQIKYHDNVMKNLSEEAQQNASESKESARKSNRVPRIDITKLKIVESDILGGTRVVQVSDDEAAKMAEKAVVTKTKVDSGRKEESMSKTPVASKGPESALNKIQNVDKKAALSIADNVAAKGNSVQSKPVEKKVEKKVEIVQVKAKDVEPLSVKEMKQDQSIADQLFDEILSESESEKTQDVPKVIVSKALENSVKTVQEVTESSKVEENKSEVVDSSSEVDRMISTAVSSENQSTATSVDTKVTTDDDHDTARDVEDFETERTDRSSNKTSSRSNSKSITSKSTSSTCSEMSSSQKQNNVKPQLPVVNETKQEESSDDESSVLSRRIELTDRSISPTPAPVKAVKAVVKTQEKVSVKTNGKTEVKTPKPISVEKKTKETKVSSVEVKDTKEKQALVDYKADEVREKAIARASALNAITTSENEKAKIEREDTKKNIQAILEDIKNIEENEDAATAKVLRESDATSEAKVKEIMEKRKQAAEKLKAEKAKQLSKQKVVVNSVSLEAIEEVPTPAASSSESSSDSESSDDSSDDSDQENENEQSGDEADENHQLNLHSEDEDDEEEVVLKTVQGERRKKQGNTYKKPQKIKHRKFPKLPKSPVVGQRKKTNVSINDLLSQSYDDAVMEAKQNNLERDLQRKRQEVMKKNGEKLKKMEDEYKKQMARLKDKEISLKHQTLLKRPMDFDLPRAFTASINTATIFNTDIIEEHDKTFKLKEKLLERQRKTKEKLQAIKEKEGALLKDISDNEEDINDVIKEKLDELSSDSDDGYDPTKRAIKRIVRKFKKKKMEGNEEDITEEDKVDYELMNLSTIDKLKKLKNKELKVEVIKQNIMLKDYKNEINKQLQHVKLKDKSFNEEVKIEKQQKKLENLENKLLIKCEKIDLKNKMKDLKLNVKKFKHDTKIYNKHEKLRQQHDEFNSKHETNQSKKASKLYQKNLKVHAKEKAKLEKDRIKTEKEEKKYAIKEFENAWDLLSKIRTYDNSELFDKLKGSGTLEEMGQKILKSLKIFTEEGKEIYEQRTTEQLEEIKKLRHDKQRFEDRLERVQQQLKNKTKNSVTMTAYNQLQHTNGGLRSDLETTRQKVATLQKDINDKTKEIKLFQKENQTCKDLLENSITHEQYTNIKRRNKILNNTITQRKQERDEMQQTKNILAEQVRKIKIEVQEQKTLTHKQDLEIENVKYECSSWRDKYNDLQEKHDSTLLEHKNDNNYLMNQLQSELSQSSFNDSSLCNQYKQKILDLERLTKQQQIKIFEYESKEIKAKHMQDLVSHLLNVQNNILDTYDAQKKNDLVRFQEQKKNLKELFDGKEEELNWKKQAICMISEESQTDHTTFKNTSAQTDEDIEAVIAKENQSQRFDSSTQTTDVIVVVNKTNLREIDIQVDMKPDLIETSCQTLLEQNDGHTQTNFDQTTSASCQTESVGNEMSTQTESNDDVHNNQEIVVETTTTKPKTKKTKLSWLTDSFKKTVSKEKLSEAEDSIDEIPMSGSPRSSLNTSNKPSWLNDSFEKDLGSYNITPRKSSSTAAATTTTTASRKLVRDLSRDESLSDHKTSPRSGRRISWLHDSLDKEPILDDSTSPRRSSLSNAPKQRQQQQQTPQQQRQQRQLERQALDESIDDILFDDMPKPRRQNLGRRSSTPEQLAEIERLKKKDEELRQQYAYKPRHYYEGIEYELDRDYTPMKGPLPDPFADLDYFKNKKARNNK